MNSTVLVGRVGRDAEIRYFESGKVKANFSIAVNRWDAKTKSEVADWFNIDVWDKLAEFAGEYVKKGVQVVVDGRIALNKWTDKASGMIEKTSTYLQAASGCWDLKEIFKRYNYDYQF